MKLDNGTKYNGRDLRGLLLACAAYYEVKLIHGIVSTFVPKKGTNTLAQSNGTARRFLLELAPVQRYIDDLSAVDKLAAVNNDGWAAIPALDFLQLCSGIDWIVSESPDWHTELPPWAEDRQVRFKVPPPKVKPTGADYHQVEIGKIEGQIKRWRENQRKTEQNLVRIKRGIKQREKKLKYHAKQRDKKAGGKV